MLGVVSFLWHDSDLRHHAGLLGPASAAAIADTLATAQVIGGIAVLHPRGARAGSLLVGLVFALLSLACVPGIVHAPRAYVQYGDFFENFAVVCGALGVYAAAGVSRLRASTPRTAARIGFALCAISFAVAQTVYFRLTASLVPAWIPPNQAFWVTLTTIAFLLAAVALLVDRGARVALHLTALMLAVFAVVVWVPLIAAQPAALANWSELAETLLIAACAWNVARVSR